LGTHSINTFDTAFAKLPLRTPFFAKTAFEASTKTIFGNSLSKHFGTSFTELLITTPLRDTHLPGSVLFEHLLVHSPLETYLGISFGKHFSNFFRGALNPINPTNSHHLTNPPTLLTHTNPQTLLTHTLHVRYTYRVSHRTWNDASPP